MRRRDIIWLSALSALVITPASVALAAYYVTRNPNLRPLGITLEKLIEAGQIADRDLIVAQITFGDRSDTNLSLAEYEAALSKAFDTFQTEVQVRFRERRNSDQITILYKVGNSVIGPFPMSRAAEGIRASVEAERMITTERKRLRKIEQERAENGGFWQQLTN